MDSVNKKIIEFFIENNMIKAEDKELYQYALSITISALIHIFTLVVLGIIFGLLVESIVFYLCFIAIRKFAGGYHAKTAGGCYLFSVLLSVLLLITFKLSVLNISYIIAVTVFTVSFISLVCIWVMSPLDTENNPLSEKEKNIYGKVAKVISLLIFIVFSILLLLNQYNIALSMSFGIFMSALVLTMRRIQMLLTKTK
ncbi:MAG: accessory gene regulator B family protein [Clostridia bacterium]|nr:accessory gene regulator B family protein [Clostridia bacterium]MEE1124678.1 accessory gene regulator B family protein [Acutalibacteraceae bacterium]